MPIHDWTKVNAGTFHDLHVGWIAEIRRRLNGGLLPEGYYAQAEQVVGNTIPDVLTLQQPGTLGSNYDPAEKTDNGGTAVLTAPPKTSITEYLSMPATIAPPQRRIAIRRSTGDRIVAMLEIVAPANKDRLTSVEQFVDKAVVAFGEGIHLQIIDLFPPGKFDPQGLHAIIRSRLEGVTHEVPLKKPLTLTAYNAATATCYVEPAAVGDVLAELPLFLTPGEYVNVPLEQTYMAAYESVPRRWKAVIESPTTF